MINIRGVITNEASTLKAKISIHMEIVLHSLTLSAITSLLQKELYAAAREILEQLIPQIEAIWLKEKAKSIEICRFVKRTLKTIFGEIHFRYRQTKEAGKYLRPLLEILGIGKSERLTRDLMAVASLSALYTSYRKALKIAGHVCSLSALWYTVQKEGKAYSHMKDQALYYYSEGSQEYAISEKDFAVVMIDEIHIRHTKRKEHIRVKVARLVVVRYHDGSYASEPVQVFATAKGNQKSFLKKASQVFNGTAGLHHIPRIIVVTDGCDMGRDFCGFYPGKAVWQLDWWHLWNYAHKGCKFEKELERRIWDLLNVEKVDEALGILRMYQGIMKTMEEKLQTQAQKIYDEQPGPVKPYVFWSSNQLKHFEKLITYLSNNREGIYGVKAFVKDIPAEYLLFGSGPVERLQAVMIAYRMKKQGKHWSVDGADNLIQLLSREWNGEELDSILEEGIKGLNEWEELSHSDTEIESEVAHSRSKKKSKKRFDLSPNPVQCIPLLKRGRADSFFTLFKGISELKTIPHIVDLREEGCVTA